VPEDVSIIGFDDVPLSQLTWPELTTVRQPREELARAALPLLMRQIKGETNRPEIVSLKPQLIIRQSTAPAPKLSKLRRERKRA
jgi:LacI family transcriptional regulator